MARQFPCDIQYLLDKHTANERYTKSMSDFEQGDTVSAFETVELHLLEVLKNYKHLCSFVADCNTDSRSQFGSPTMLCFMDMVHLAWCVAARSGMQLDQIETDNESFDFAGYYFEETKTVLNKVMDDQREFNHDHVLHPRLKYIWTEMRLVSREITRKSIKKLDKLFEGAKRILHDCDSTKTDCVLMGAAIYQCYIFNLSPAGDSQGALWSSMEFYEWIADSPVRFTEEEFLKRKLRVLKFSHVELSNSLNGFTEEGIVEYEKFLKVERKISRSNPQVLTCRITQSLASMYLNSPDFLENRRVKKTVTRARRTLNTAGFMWRRLAEIAETNLRHNRYSAFQVHKFFFEFRTERNYKKKQMAAVRMKTAFFKDCAELVIKSPDIQYLDVFELQAQVYFETDMSFDYLSTVYNSLKRQRQDLPLPCFYDELFQTIKQVFAFKNRCLLSSNECEIMSSEMTRKKFAYQLRALNNCKNSKNIYWFQAGCSLLSHACKKTGDLKFYRIFRNATGKFYAKVDEDDDLIARSVSYSSSSLTENCVFNSSSINILYMELINPVNHILYSQNDISQIAQKFSDSWKLLGKVLKKLKFREENIKQWNIHDHLVHNEPQFLFVRQLSEPGGAAMTREQILDEILKLCPNSSPPIWVVLESVWLPVLLDDGGNELKPMTRFARDPAQDAQSIPAEPTMTSCSVLLPEKLSQIENKLTLFDCLRESLVLLINADSFDIESLVAEMQNKLNSNPQSYWISETIHFENPSPYSIHIVLE